MLTSCWCCPPGRAIGPSKFSRLSGGTLALQASAIRVSHHKQAVQLQVWRPSFGTLYLMHWAGCMQHCCLLYQPTPLAAQIGDMSLQEPACCHVGPLRDKAGGHMQNSGLPCTQHGSCAALLGDFAASTPKAAQLETTMQAHLDEEAAELVLSGTPLGPGDTCRQARHCGHDIPAAEATPHAWT